MAAIFAQSAIIFLSTPHSETISPGVTMGQPEDIGLAVPAATDESHPFGMRIRGVGARSAGGR
ncbi:MAG TPA: hypothetical protein VMR62_33400 [Bryobacteraceae bacterium]|nr:hypothetical protein [Bryobacteraceae bacterium]